eukprot:4745005-Pleurochrysis_carterae.AAC.2
MQIPFRDSKLTRLLTDSLGGNTKTALCATIGPAVCVHGPRRGGESGDILTAWTLMLRGCLRAAVRWLAALLLDIFTRCCALASQSLASASSHARDGSVDREWEPHRAFPSKLLSPQFTFHFPRSDFIRERSLSILCSLSFSSPLFLSPSCSSLLLLP